MNDSPDRHRRAAWLVTLFLVGYWIVLFVATHVPSDFPLVPPERTDKLVHFSAFFVLGGLLAAAWEFAAGRLTVRHLIAAWLVLAAYAAVDEISQPPFGRARSFDDWLADVTGVACGLLLFLAWRRWKS